VGRQLGFVLVRPWRTAAALPWLAQTVTGLAPLAGHYYNLVVHGNVAHSPALPCVRSARHMQVSTN
jgi:hypothetical protein